MFEMPPPFDLSAVERAIVATRFATHLHHRVTTSSTSDLALAAARAGAEQGVWIADEQTAGRGRSGHTWHSAPGDGLYVSVLLTEPIPISNGPALSFAAAIAAQSAIAAVTEFRPKDTIDIRWPNDLVLNTARGPRKYGGILIESAASAVDATLRYVVLGIGINCNHISFPPELETLATSLRKESRRPSELISREGLLSALLIALDREIESWSNDNAPARDPAVFSSWIRGKQVQVAEDGGYTGVTAGLTPDGYLKVLAAEGRTRIVRSGGVRELEQLSMPATPEAM